eukprot:6871133-Pyramimonas_sp.AAC.1
MGWSHITNAHDLATAFSSSAWPAMSSALSCMFAPELEGFGAQRIRWASLTLAGHDKDIVLRPGRGGCMGDAFAVRSFVHTFAPAVDKWQESQQ